MKWPATSAAPTITIVQAIWAMQYRRNLRDVNARQKRGHTIRGGFMFLTMRSLRLGLMLAFALGLGGAQAQTIEITPDLAKIIDGARQEGRLQLRSTTSVNGAAGRAKAAPAGRK